MVCRDLIKGGHEWVGAGGLARAGPKAGGKPAFRLAGVACRYYRVFCSRKFPGSNQRMFMNFMANLFFTGAVGDEPAGRETGLSERSHDIMVARMTSALTPALSPRRGGIVRRSFENLY